MPLALTYAVAMTYAVSEDLRQGTCRWRGPAPGHMPWAATPWTATPGAASPGGSCAMDSCAMGSYTMAQLRRGQLRRGQLRHGQLRRGQLRRVAAYTEKYTTFLIDILGGTHRASPSDPSFCFSWTPMTFEQRSFKVSRPTIWNDLRAMYDERLNFSNRKIPNLLRPISYFQMLFSSTSSFILKTTISSMLRYTLAPS